MPLVRRLTVRIFESEDGVLQLRLTDYDATTGTGGGRYEFSGSSSAIFQECVSVLDAIMFTCLATAESIDPGDQLLLY